MLKYLFLIVRPILWGLLIFSCSVCREKTPLPGALLCKQLDSLYFIHGQKQMDSIVALAASLPRGQHYAVVCRGVSLCLDYSEERRQQATRFLQQLGSLSFPEVNDKYTGFLLLEQYENISFFVRRFVPELVDPEQIASLLFDMENRWRLTPEEKCRLLIIKSKIYDLVFKESKSGVAIACEALKLAYEQNADAETMRRILTALYRNYVGLDEQEKFITDSRDVFDYIANNKFDTFTEDYIPGILGQLYLLDNDYQNAYSWLNKTEKARNGVYLPNLLEACLAIDSLEATMAHIEKMRERGKMPLIEGCLAWYEACVRLKMGDVPGYERCLKESVRKFDDHANAFNEVNACAPSEAYARLLWEQGKRDEAIRRMELVARKLLHYDLGYDNVPFSQFGKATTALKRLYLLRDYYRASGRLADAYRQSLLCDSLQQQFVQAQLKAENRKNEARMYVADLSRRLELKADILARERQKIFVICFLLGLSLLGMLIFILLYRQRNKQLNVLYARQKEIEHLQVEKQKMLAGRKKELSADEQLFRELEKQFYEEQLFRNPGFSRDDLCRLGGSNRMYVSTCINKYAETNINQWINKARIDYALELIRSGETNLLALAENAGFSSNKSFFRSFKQFTSLTPRQYIVREARRVSDLENQEDE